MSTIEGSISYTEGVSVADQQFQSLLEVMPDITEAVNRFDSPAAQICALRLLVSAVDDDLARRFWDHPDLWWQDLLVPKDRPSVGLGDLLDEEQWLEANTLLDQAEQRDAERPGGEDALANSFDADELRRFAALAAQGEHVTLVKP